MSKRRFDPYDAGKSDNRNSSRSNGAHYSDDLPREISSSSRKRNRKSAAARLKSLNIKRALSMVMCVLFLLSGSAMIYYYKVLDSMNFVDFEQESDPTGTSYDADDDSFSDDELLSDSQILNVMLFGDDSRDVTGTEYGRSDTMILMSLDARNQKIKLTSFQRDTYVNIPGYGYNKLNASYAYGGPQLTIRTIQANFGIDIDRYAVVGFESFKNIINTLGGVDIELTQDEIDYINFKCSSYTITQGAGTVHLNGEQALWYARDRGWESAEFTVAGDDWDRTSRQRNLLQILVKDMRSASLTQILSIINSIGPMITTNLKKDEITVLAANSLKYLNYDMEEISVPMPDLWKYSWSSDGQSIIEITDWSACRKQLAQFVFGDISANTSAAE